MVDVMYLPYLLCGFLLGSPTDRIQPPMTTIHVDIVEYNQTRHGTGDPLHQIVFWDLHQDGQYHVTDWRLLLPSNELGQQILGPIGRAAGIPNPLIWTEPTACYRVYWTVQRITRTTWDPEVRDRQVFSVSMRRRLHDHR